MILTRCVGLLVCLLTSADHLTRTLHPLAAMSDFFTPENLKRWEPGVGASGFDSAANYVGADLSAFYLAPIHKTRDTADTVTLSNWRVIAAELDRLAKHEETGETTIGHWACGWFAVYLIHETDTEALQCADEWAASLADYPVADESDLSELEQEEEQEAWESWGCREWREVLTAALTPYAPESAPDVQRFGIDTGSKYWAKDEIDKLSEDQLYESWRFLADMCGWHCEHESDGPRFNFEDPAALLTCEVLANLTGLPLLPPGQQWRKEPYPWPDGSTAPLIKAELV